MERLCYIFEKTKYFSRKVKTADISTYASSIAFFLFVSIFPLLFLVCFMIPYTPFSEADIMIACMKVVPKQMNSWIIGLISQIYNRPRGMLPATVVITIWSAGKGTLALMRALNRIHDTAEERGYLILRALASLYTIIILLGLTATFILGVFGRRILNWIIDYLPEFKAESQLASVLSYCVVVAVMVFAFCMIYTFLPNKKLSFKKQLWGSLFVVLAWIIFTYGFSLYVEYFSSFTAYGTLGTIILFLLWLYFCSYIMLIGAVVNQMLEGC